MRELDSRTIAAEARSMFGLWLILVVSTWVGVIIGGAVLTIGMLVMSAGTLGLGLIALVEMFAVITAFSGAIILCGFVILPLAATVAAHIKLRYAKAFAVGDWALVGLPDTDPLTKIVNFQAHQLGLETPPSTMTITNVANAFAIRATYAISLVAIGQPLIDSLTPEEVAAIVGHELGHIVSDDARRTVFAVQFQQFLAWFFLFHGLQKFVRWFMTPIAELMILKLSRNREYWADAIGAALTSKAAMISALRKLHELPYVHTCREMIESEQMFFGVGRWRSTHPSLDQRVAALEAETYINRLPFIDRTVRPSTKLDAAEKSRPQAKPDPQLTSGF